jgi:putative membrane protein
MRYTGRDGREEMVRKEQDGRGTVERSKPDVGIWLWHGLGSGVMMILGGLILLALVIWLIVSLTRNQGDRMEPLRGNDPRLLEILKQRYARGEISREQFEELRRNLIV